MLSCDEASRDIHSCRAGTTPIPWLKAVAKAKLEPYITLETLQHGLCEDHPRPHETCEVPSISTYRADVERLVKGLLERHKTEVVSVPVRD
jgi:hypothetical protein